MFFKANEITGSKIKRSVNKGDLLTTSSMYLDYDVEKGARCGWVFQSKSIRLETLGMALEKGLIGDNTVSVKNQQRKVLRGVVIGKIEFESS
ncbi:flagella basal body P-ring formation protein FlgA [Vibrio chagasii]|nr:flagella basal body P-ring formation protein FlgA [Vibrio chagasii]